MKRVKPDPKKFIKELDSATSKRPFQHNQVLSSKPALPNSLTQGLGLTIRR